MKLKPKHKFKKGDRVQVKTEDYDMIGSIREVHDNYADIIVDRCIKHPNEAEKNYINSGNNSRYSFYFRDLQPFMSQKSDEWASMWDEAAEPNEE